ncbi:hypothetical protein GMO_00570 [Gluconobacter morbifer G707]|uniref:Uncharacterized protein n=1 Tax=Gluconobacter morbifer G707 TaxID=1088869 RepID=G6XEZ2_9PROT|nr:hypothetical protein GMO_00570 [Gluconobacter morbifer G707]
MPSRGISPTVRWGSARSMVSCAFMNILSGHFSGHDMI